MAIKRSILSLIHALKREVIYPLFCRARAFVKKNPVLTFISSLVLCAHLTILFCHKSTPSPLKPINKPLAIRTYHPPPPAPKVRQKRSSPSKRKKSEQKKPLRRKGKKRVAKKKNRPVLQELREALAKIAPVESKIGADVNVTIPDQLKKLNIDSRKSNQEEKVLADPLIAYLRERLKLPEYGDVTVEITTAYGKLTKMTVLASESEINTSYLKQHLSLLLFPNKEEGKTTRIITFCNEN